MVRSRKMAGHLLRQRDPDPVPTPPAFISYRPASYLRPFNLSPQFSQAPIP